MTRFDFLWLCFMLGGIQGTLIVLTVVEIAK